MHFDVLPHSLPSICSGHQINKNTNKNYRKSGSHRTSPLTYSSPVIISEFLLLFAFRAAYQECTVKMAAKPPQQATHTTTTNLQKLDFKNHST